MTELDKLIQDRLNKPFEWGENDCITFCMDAIKCVTGIDHLKLENVRDWNTPQSAKKTFEHGGLGSDLPEIKIKSSEVYVI